MVYCLAYQRRRSLNYSMYKMQQQDLFLALESFLTLHRRFMSCTGCRFLCVLTLKILLLTFKCINGLAATYLSDLISIKSNSLYNLRSTGKLLLDHPKGKMLTTLGARSFSAAAPKLWNELPVELHQATSLDSFKFRLKTYLFKKYFYSL